MCQVGDRRAVKWKDRRSVGPAERNGREGAESFVREGGSASAPGVTVCLRCRQLDFAQLASALFLRGEWGRLELP